MLHVLAACSWCTLHIYHSCPSFLSSFISVCCVHPSCSCFMLMLHVHASCPCFMPVRHVHASCPCCRCCRLLLHAFSGRTGTCCMSMSLPPILLIQAARSCYMFLLYVKMHAIAAQHDLLHVHITAWPCGMFALLVLAACPCSVSIITTPQNF
jgi:hypothetical protein